MPLPSSTDIERGCQSIADLVAAQPNEDVQAAWRLLHHQLLLLARGINLGTIALPEANSLIQRVDDWTVATFGAAYAFTRLIRPLQTTSEEQSDLANNSQYTIGALNGSGYQSAQGNNISQTNTEYQGDHIAGDKREITTGQYTEWNLNTAGDFVGKDKTVHGDEVRGDKIGQQNIYYGSPGPKESITPPFMVEPLPDGFVRRNKEHEELVKLLLDRHEGEPVAITAALRGAGGFGKTVMARSVCHDDRVRATFPDGILWVTLGDKPTNLATMVEDWIYATCGKRSGFTSDDAIFSHLRGLLTTKKMLLVIDDIWNAADLRPFQQGGPDCAHLITTRDSATLPTNASKVNIDAMTPREAIALLAWGLGGDALLEVATKHQLQALAARLGEWPLLIKLAGAVLRQSSENQPVLEAIAYINEALENNGLLAFDADDPLSRDQAVAATIGISLAHLKENEQGLYAKLAIFPEDSDIPLAILTRLWGSFAPFNDFKTKELCLKLNRLSLVLQYDPTNQTIRLHDVIRAYLRQQEHDRLAEINNRFLASYKLTNWADLPTTEPYLWDNLFYHLGEATRHSEMSETAKDLHYLARKTALRGTIAVENDLERVQTLSENDPSLVLLARCYRQNGHILSLCPTENEIAITLHARLQHNKELTALCSDWEPTLSRPYLYAAHPLPDLADPTLIRTLTGHSDSMWGCAISPDGKTLVSASDDKTLKVWDLASGREIRTLTDHSDAVRGCAISSDGKTLVSASFDNTLKVWDLTTGREVRTLTDHSDYVIGCAISPDGKTVVSASKDKTLKVWDLASGTEVHTLTGHSGYVWGCVISPNGKTLISASSDKTLKVWDLASGQEVRTLTGHSGSVICCAISPDGKLVVSASFDETLKVWDLASGTEVHTFTGHSFDVRGCAISPDGKLVVSASGDRTLKVWDLASGTEVRTLTGHSFLVNGCTISPDGKTLVSASSDKTLKVWDLAFGTGVRTLTGHRNDVRGCAISPDGKLIVSASDDKTLKVWDLASGTEVCTLTGHSDAVNGCAISPDGKLVVSASRDMRLKVWDLASGEVRTFTGHSWSVEDCAISPDGKLVVSASFDKTLKVWDLASGTEVHTLTGHRNDVRGCAISLDGKLVVSASVDKTLKVWDLASGTEVHTLTGHSHYVEDCAISHDGRIVVSASLDKTLKVWDLASGQEVRTLTGHSDAVNGCAISPDGKTLISASFDETLKVWDLETGGCLATIRVDGPLYGCAVSSDNEHIVAVGGKGVYFLGLAR